MMGGIGAWHFHHAVQKSLVTARCANEAAARRVDGPQSDLNLIDSGNAALTLTFGALFIRVYKKAQKFAFESGEMRMKSPFAKSVKKAGKVVRMRHVLTASAGAILATVVSAGPVLAQSFDVTCTSPDDVRQIIVVAPGQTGKACDVQYTKNRGRTVSTPYFANSDRGYCLEKAALIQSKLTASRYTCAGVGSDARPAVVAQAAPQSATQKTTATAPAQASSPVKAASLRDVSASVPSPDDAANSERDAFLKNLRDQTPSEPGAEKIATPSQSVRDQALAQYRAQQAGPTPTPTPSAAPTAPTAPSVPSVPAVRDVTGVNTASAARVAAQPGPLASEKSDQLVALQTGIARSGPVTLTNPAPAPSTVAAATPASNGISREDRQKLVGATPVVAKTANVPTTPSPAVSTAAGPVEAVPSPAVSPAPIRAVNDSFRRVASALSPAVANRPRSRPEIIKATLMAQAAAWNEGDIEAFMEGYWRNKDLTFVSGTKVTRGWTQTLRRYKDRYGNGAALGQLGFDIANVEMLANDIAIVVGRFTLNRNEMIDSGTFTLVMKQFEGAWRIVHDHTVADAPASPSEATKETSL